MSINLKDFSGAWKKGFQLTFAFLLFAFTLFAQPKDNAPYSRFGLGKPANQSLSTAAFGGLTAAYVDGLHVNVLNPASLGALHSATFEVGMYGEHSTLKLDGQETEVWSGNLSHLALAFPMRNPLNDVLDKKQRKFFWGMNVALMPNTTVGYDILTNDVLSEGDTTLNVFQGTGGTNKLVWGNGVKHKDFSIGMNINYIFGKLETTRGVVFQDRLGAFSNSFQDDISIRGVVLSFGAQYKLDLDKEVLKDGSTKSRQSLIFGIYGNPTSNFNTQSTKLRIGINNSLIPIVTDTLLNISGVKQSGKLPSEITFGVTYQHTNKLRVGLEFNSAKWSKYENEAKPETLRDSKRIALGAEYLPNSNAYNNYFQRIRYRAGFYFRSDPRLDDLDQFALTMGLGLPVVLPQRKTSYVNLAIEIGKYRTDNAIEENFVKMSLGFTLNDSGWFYKRKFR